MCALLLKAMQAAARSIMLLLHSQNQRLDACGFIGFRAVEGFRAFSSKGVGGFQVCEAYGFRD